MDVPYQIDAYESITVGTNAVGFTNPEFHNYAFVSVEDQPVRFRIDGGDPTGVEGHALAAGDTLTLEGGQQVASFRAIRDSSASTDATIRVSLGYRERGSP